MFRIPFQKHVRITTRFARRVSRRPILELLEHRTLLASYIWYQYGTSGTPTILADISGDGIDAQVTGCTFVPDRPPSADLIPGVPTTAGSLLIDGNAGSGVRTIDTDVLPTELIQANGGYTFETWFLREGVDNNTTGVQDFFDAVESARILRDTNQVFWGVGIGTDSVTSPTVLNVGEWYHLAVVFDSGSNPLVDGSLTGTLRIYIDGNLTASGVVTLSSDRDANSVDRPLAIGRHSSDGIPTETFNGELFETRISLGALQPDQFLLPKNEPLMVTTQPPQTVGLDSKFDAQISAEDASGNVDTSFNGPVTIALDNNPGGATLGGTLTVNAVNGLADFPDLSLNKAGSGYTLKATSAGLTSVDTGSFTVSYIVSNTSDSLTSDSLPAPGSFRDMITAVDADPIANGPDQITFASDISGGTISLLSLLPALTRDQVTLTGPITLDGTSAGGDGLDISGNQDSVQNVTFKSFSGNGIFITGNNDSITGSQITGNQNGIVVSGGATGNTIGGTAAGAGNVITGNTNDGIDLDNALQTVIQGNWVGTDASSTLGLGNGNDGIEISDGANGTTIGGTVVGAGEPDRQ